jgi:hypothetical protein
VLPADRRPVPARRARRAVAVVATSVLVMLAAAGCVGKTGRNDDYVAPGSPEAGPSGQVVPIDD